MTEKSNNQVKSPWPTDAAMKQVYENNLWGSGTGAFYSGYGSHDPLIVAPYVAAVSTFLKSFSTSLNVCDLGCGDFNVGEQLVPFAKKYIAVDIVPELIARNKEVFNEPHLEFYCLDLAKDDLPKGDCALVRQVLQHLSNIEVQQILDKLSKYKYVLLTEHLPVGDFESNKDIISGQGTRLKKKSGLDVLAPPFDFKVKSCRELLSLPLKDGKGIIVTWLLELF